MHIHCTLCIFNELYAYMIQIVLYANAMYFMPFQCTVCIFLVLIMHIYSTLCNFNVLHAFSMYLMYIHCTINAILWHIMQNHCTLCIFIVLDIYTIFFFLGCLYIFMLIGTRCIRDDIFLS